VTTNENNKNYLLRIKGNVIPTPGKLRQKVGNLMIDRKMVKLGKITNTGIIEDTLIVKNIGKEQFELVFPDLPSYLSINVIPTVLQPEQRGQIEFVFDAAKRNDFGIINDKINFMMMENSVSFDKGVLSFNVTIEEDFSDLSEYEKENPPQIYFPEGTKNLGIVHANETRTIIFEYENKGKRDLILRNVKTTHRSFTVGKYDKLVKPGNSGFLEVTLKPVHNMNNYRANIMVYSNDFHNPKKILRINADLKKDKKKDTLTSLSNRMFKNISTAETKSIIEEYEKNPDFVILDVRTSEEYKQDFIRNAVNIDHKSDSFIEVIKLFDKKKIYLIYCESGIRSSEAMNIMKGLGFQTVYHYEEGISAWRELDLPTEKK